MMRSLKTQKLIVLGLFVFFVLCLSTMWPSSAVTSIQGKVSYRDTDFFDSSYWVEVLDGNYEYVSLGANYRSTDNGGFEILGLTDGTYYFKARTDSSPAFSNSKYEKIIISSGIVSSGLINLVIEKTQFAGKITYGASAGEFSGFSVESTKIGVPNSWAFETFVHSDGTFLLSALSDGKYWFTVKDDANKKAVGELYIDIIDGKCISTYPELLIKDWDDLAMSDNIEFTGIIKDGKNHLSWTYTGTAPIVGYYILRSSAPGFLNMSESITDFVITENSYADANIEPGKVYYYEIVGVFADGTTTWGSKDVSPEMPKGRITLQVSNRFMTVNGVKKEVDPGFATSPKNVQGRVLLPVRSLVEAMGGTVAWDGATSSVIIKYKTKQLVFKIGSKSMTMDGALKTMDVPAQIIGGRTFLPVRVLVESLGGMPTWEGKTQSVTIVYEQ